MGQQEAKVQCSAIQIGDVNIRVSTEMTCLGVVLDSEIKLTTNVRRLAGRCFYYLQQLWVVRRSVTADVAKTLVNAFITSRVDYCHSMFNNINAVGILPLQRVLNAAAHVIVRKYDHITASIRDDLHWLPVRQRVEFKCRLVYKCLHQSAPSYLAAMCVNIDEMDGRRHLRSAAHGDLVKPTTRGRMYGQRSFAVAGPSIWNSLSSSLKDYLLAINEFQKKFKTELFRRAYAL